MIPPGRLDGTRGADERENAIYDLVPGDCLAGAGRTCVLGLRLNQR